ncbi:MAG: hypothetical protein N3B16_10770 [Candidatus Aminicenantes bacterium]|nr:hypothetical protein [Candidatus Aminicenantes bacterium]
MNKDLAVLLVVGGQKSRKLTSKNPCLQPILGQSSLDIVAETVNKLKPQKKVLIGENIREEALIPFGWERADFPNKEKKTWFKSWLRTFFSEGGPSNLLVINSAYPLLEEDSLKNLLKRHLNQRSFLTFFIPGQKKEEVFKENKKETSPFNYIAFVLNKEVLNFVDIENDNLIAGSLKELLSLKIRLEKDNKKVSEVFLSEKEILDVRSSQDRPKIVSHLRQTKISNLSEKGVSFIDPHSVWIDLKVKIGSGSIISPAVVIEGNSTIGREAKIYPFVHILDSQIGHQATILTSCVIEGSRLGNQVRVGPFTHLRPGTVLKTGAHVGNFVEMKKTIFGRHSKAMHLSYLGDSLVGDKVNIGAGTITCNFDGRQKHQTIIEKGAFIGSGTELVAPVKIGRGAYVGAGSTITKNVSPDALAIARSRQVEIPGWAKRRRSQ